MTGNVSLLLVVLLSCARCSAGDPGVAPPPRRLLIKGAEISEPEAPGQPVLLRGFNLDFKLGSDYPYPIAQDRALKTLLPGANLVRLVMNHWHDSGGEGDCATDLPPHYITQQCLEQFDRTLAWSTGDLGAWSVITARSALAAGDGGAGRTIFTNTTLKGQWLAMWGALARRYSATDNIAGFEVRKLHTCCLSESAGYRTRILTDLICAGDVRAAHECQHLLCAPAAAGGLRRHLGSGPQSRLPHRTSEYCTFSIMTTDNSIPFFNSFIPSCPG
jgi:hypothetical protein